MPRKTRMYLPGVPPHIVQRGNNREARFFEIENHQFHSELIRLTTGAGQLLPKTFYW